MSPTLKDKIKDPNSRVFRRCYVKRRLQNTGQFESGWTEITDSVIKWGKIKTEVDTARINSFRFPSAQIVVDNTQGLFNPEDDDASLWYGYSVQQRSLLRIDAGFTHQTLGADGIWRNQDLPSGSLWGSSIWDSDLWDAGSFLFVGIIQGDITVSDKNQVTLKVNPINQIFRDFAARNLRNMQTQTASDFFNLIRDQTDGANSYIFRPFFNNTTTGFEIDTTTRQYAELATNTADNVRDKTVWDVMERLAEAENKTCFIEGGIFKFTSRDVATSVVAYEFHGVGSHDTEYGTTIKQIKGYGPKISKFYSRVEVKFREDDTITSLAVIETTLTVNANNSAWLYGQKTFQVENTWINNTTNAENIATSIFNEFSSLKRELEFSASFVPQVSIRDRISVSYDSSPVRSQSLWDRNDWADDSTNTSDDLIWDNSKGDAIRLSDKEMKILSIEHDLDNFETSIVAREI